MTDSADHLSNVVVAVIVGLPLASVLFWNGDPVDVALTYLFLLNVVAWGEYDD